jgi:hypothetical protein
MTDDKKAEMLLKLLTTAMIVHIYEREKIEDLLSDAMPPHEMPGVVGGPEKPGDPEPEHVHDENCGHDSDPSPEIFSLNKMTDLVMRSLQAAMRYRVAKEIGALHQDQDDEGIVERTPFGVTFTLKFNKDITPEQSKAIEIAAEMTQAYFHYRLFESEPSVQQFIEGVDWEAGLSPKRVNKIRAEMERILQTIGPIMHEHYQDIKEHGNRIFNQSLAYLHELLDNHKKSAVLDLTSMLSGMGIKISDNMSIIKISNI